MCDGTALGSHHTERATCLHHLFEAQAGRRPSAPAIVSGDTTLFYGEVEQRANQLARHLRCCGVKTGDRVGLFLERSPDAMVAILAILKAGAAYLPLDPSHPADRIRHIVEEAAVATVVSETALCAAAFVEAGRRVIAIDDPSRPWHPQPTGRLSSEEIGLTSADLCYVLYTSGSTGRPKGVMTEHRNVVSFVAAFNQVLGLTAEHRVFQGFSLGFDGSVEEMWMAFSNGGALVVPERGAARFGDDLARLITQGRAHVFSTVPTSLAMISDPLPTVELLIVSGERCSKEAVNRWATPSRRMLNVYGPTEATVNATVAECRPDRPVTIGAPLPGYQAYILDEKARPVSPGENGELFIAGPGVARGYLGQSALTKRHFVDLPVASIGDPLGHPPVKPRDGTVRAYRTGDLVSLDEGGDLLFHGRIDSQVKVRGFRIELSEIEAVLCEHAHVGSAAVAVVERDGKSQLAAYVVAEDPARAVDRNAILTLLTSRLPSYMIPAWLDVIDAWPTLSSGKADRTRLPAPAAALVRTDRTLRAPSRPREASLLRVVSRVFRNETISVDDDFFRTLGGYSLLAAQLVTELRKELHLEVAIRDVYDHPTVSALAAHLGASPGGERAADGPPSDPAEQASSRRTFATHSRATWSACVSLQALVLYVVYGVMILPWLGALLPLRAWRAGNLSLAACAGVSLLVWGGTWPALLALSVAVKWIFIGRYRPGAHPLWGILLPPLLDRPALPAHRRHRAPGGDTALATLSPRHGRQGGKGRDPR